MLLETVSRFQVDEKNMVHCHRRNIIVKRHGGQLPVQIIYWNDRTPEDLVSDFDIDAVRAYTDGRKRYLHTSCVKAWEKRAVMEVNRNPIGYYRLAKMMNKGFSIQLPSTIVVDGSLRKATERNIQSQPFDIVQVKMLADCIEGLPKSDDIWRDYNNVPLDAKLLGETKEFTFETTVKFMRHLSAPGSAVTGVGVTHVPEYIGNALENLTTLLHFLHVDKSVQVFDMGPARLTVRVYGMVAKWPVMRVVRWEQL